MSKFGGNRNFGWGKQLGYAGHAALGNVYCGHFATTAAHSNRWRVVAQWCRRYGVRDACEITREILEAYGDDLAEEVARGEKTVTYAQNLLSTANVVLWALRGDRSVRVSPATAVGRRITIRTTPPAGLPWEPVREVANCLIDYGHERAATALLLARHFGLRIREASLLDLNKAYRQSRRLGRIAITEGTKGGRGRERERWIPTSDEASAWVGQARHLQGDGRNLIPPTMRWIEFCDHLHSVTAPLFYQYSLVGFHDLRAGYACARYAALTGHPAPCVTGHRHAEKESDQAARTLIANELGHGRIDVVGAYVGSSR